MTVYELAEKIAKHAGKPYPQWVEPGIYYVSLQSELEAAFMSLWAKTERPVPALQPIT